MRRADAVAAGAIGLVAAGSLRGLPADNIHNGLLAVSYCAVGAFVLHRRPGQREAQLFIAAGTAQAVIFAGRQVAETGTGNLGEPLARVAAWLGIWPLALVLVLVGLTIMCYPDGSLPGPAWRPVVGVMVLVGAALAVLSALWPVDYDRVGVLVDHSLALPGRDVAEAWFDGAMKVAFPAFQLVWLAAVVDRRGGPTGRRRGSCAGWRGPSPSARWPCSSAWPPTDRRGPDCSRSR